MFFPSPIRKTIACIAMACAMSPTLWAQDVTSFTEVGASYFDRRSYIEYIPGDMPLVLTAPHGGTIKPRAVNDRGPLNPGCPERQKISVAADQDTLELAKAIQETFFQRYGVRPYVVAAHIARVKLDLNRDKHEAACGNEQMETTWEDWHRFVDHAIRSSTQQFGQTLYIDVHGHGHSNQRMELGYLISSKQLSELYQSEDPNISITIAQKGKRSKSGDYADNFSLMQLPKFKNKDITLKELLFGEQGFGAMVQSLTARAVPSPDEPHPIDDEEYFNGGFNTLRFTSDEYPNTYGWQIEYNTQARRDTEETATITTKALEQFMRTHLQFKNWQLPSAIAEESNQ